MATKAEVEALQAKLTEEKKKTSEINTRSLQYFAEARTLAQNNEHLIGEIAELRKQVAELTAPSEKTYFRALHVVLSAEGETINTNFIRLNEGDAVFLTLDTDGLLRTSIARKKAE